MSDIVVLKFGGTSVSSRERWQTIEQQIRDRRSASLRPVVVCSALSGVSNQLEELLRAARRGEHEDVLEALLVRHRDFAAELGVDEAVIAAELDELSRLATGAALLGEASPRIRARTLALGELLSTRLGAAFLRERGLPARWLDVREVLQSDGRGHEARRYLAASCHHAPDPALQRALADDEVVITQGFIARDPSGATVLLGRGGSDTSAAVLAARLQAVRCEIWTDVPGLFTADPRKVVSARLLRALDYAEAQEIATMGAKVLHPRCLAPVRDGRIPLEIRCTPHPDMEGTRIGADTPSAAAQVKALSARAGLVLVSMETVGMWQQVGFLADAFAVFKQHGLSVDTVSTSETSVTVTLDPTANAIDPEVLASVVDALAPICQARVIDGCASVSLVGRGIRAILHRLAPTLELFEEHRVHLVSQAASDLNLTFVVDEGQADRLVGKLHAQLFAHRAADETLGPTWQELFAPTPKRRRKVSRPPTWWQERREALLALAAEGGPRYVYDQATLRAQARSLTALQHVDRVLYAMKANSHDGVLRTLHDEGVGFECVSPGEVARVRHLFPELPLDRVLFTPNFAARQEYAASLDDGVPTTLDNLHPLERWPELFEGREVFVRLDPGKGRGHHAHVRTAGARSKFGIGPDQLPRLVELVRRHGVKVVGLHAHAGSGVLDPTAWSDTALFLASASEGLPDVRVLDLGGGLGVPDRPGREPLDLHALDEMLGRFRFARPRFSVWIEPGRYLVAEAGVLLTRVTQLKRKGDLLYVGVDAGMNSLIRPALYGAHHHVVNLSRLDEPASVTATVVGPICETGDVLARDRRLPATEEGDVLLLATAGAYGRVMSSQYNLRAPADEVLLEG